MPTRPHGGCRQLNPCSCCCPGISLYDKLNIQFNLPTFGIHSNGVFQMRNTAYIPYVPGDTPCPPPNEGSSCCPAPGRTCCECGCDFTWPFLNDECVSSADMVCNGFPGVAIYAPNLGDAFVTGSMGCDTKTGSSPCNPPPGPGASKLALCKFSIVINIFPNNANCSGTLPGFGCGQVGGGQQITAPLDCSTFTCRCPNGFYAKFTPIFCTSPALPSDPIDPDGTIEVFSNEPDCGGGSGSCPCPDDVPCPSSSDPNVKPCWVGNPVEVNPPGHCGDVDTGSGGGAMALAAPAPSAEVATTQPPSMMQQAGNFLKSAFRHVRAGLPMVDEATKNQRMSVCQSCPEFNTARGTCNVCGCYLKAKTAWALEKCPLGKW